MTASLPTISLVMPSRNHGNFIEHALRSVLDQQYPALELIVADGGSADGTIDILDRYDAQLARWWSRPDAGPAAALNEGFREARGDIFAVLNADDFLLPGSLETVARAFMARPDVDVFSGHGFFATPTGELGPTIFSDPWDMTRFRHGACVLLQPATFFRRAAFKRAGGFRQSDRVCWDMELWADLARSGARFASIDARLAAFRLHRDSLTSRASMRAVRRRDARAVAAQLSTHVNAASDHLLHYWYRTAKFARHPLRLVRQRWFFKRTLGRWNL